MKACISFKIIYLQLQQLLLLKMLPEHTIQHLMYQEQINKVFCQLFYSVIKEHECM